MGLLKTIRITHQRHIQEELRRQILRGTYMPGSRLPPVKELATHFGICVATVQKALDTLEKQSYIVRRHGSGTYVRERPQDLTMADTVCLCMITGGHVHSDLYRQLNLHLQDKGRIVFTLDLDDKEAYVRRLRQAYVSGVPAFIVYGSPYNPVRMLEEIVEAGRTVIGILDWRLEALSGRIPRVLVDHEAGGRAAARHLFSRGHRRVLLLGTENMIEEMQPKTPIWLRTQGYGFAREWEKLGGTWTSMTSRIGSREQRYHPILEPAQIHAAISSDSRATAVFGLRDAEAWTFQNFIADQLPELRGKIEIFGYGDTDWSLAGHPPFSTVNWNIGSVVSSVCRLLDSQSAGTALQPATELVKPKLVLRPARLP